MKYFTTRLHRNVLVLNLSVQVKIPGRYQLPALLTLVNGSLSLPFCAQAIRTLSENPSSYQTGIYILCISVIGGWSLLMLPLNVLD